VNETDLAERLRDSLGALAGTVRTSPDAYERALREWRRRDRRRRLVAVVIAALVVAGADGVGLWALNQTGSRPPVVFDAPPPAVAPGP
jgi:hypothetical protein